jgi:hypothetical protein
MGNMNTAPIRTLAMAAALVWATGGCTERVNLTLADGHRQDFAFSQNIPHPVDTPWAKMTVAGVDLDRGGGSPALWWTFAFKSKVEGLKAVQIYDVTRDRPRLLIDDREPAPDRGVWRGRTTAVPVNRQSTPWLYERGDSLFAYKVVITDANGQQMTLYQPAVITRLFKSEARVRVQTWEIDRAKAAQTRPTEEE